MSDYFKRLHPRDSSYQPNLTLPNPTQPDHRPQNNLPLNFDFSDYCTRVLIRSLNTHTEVKETSWAGFLFLSGVVYGLLVAADYGTGLDHDDDDGGDGHRRSRRLGAGDYSTLGSSRYVVCARCCVSL